MNTTKPFDDKRELIRAFDECIAAFPSGRGSRNCLLLPRAACLAVKLGMDETAFMDAVREVAPDIGAADIRHTFRTAGRKVVAGGDSWRMFAAGCGTARSANSANIPRTYPRHVRNLIHAGRDVRTIDGLMQISAEPVAELSPWCQLVQHLRWLFPGQNDIAYIFRNDPPTPGVLGRSLMRVVDWLRAGCPNPPTTAGELVVPNPFTGNEGETADGKRSFIAQSCLAAFPHMILEFDEMPLETQCQFWAGFIRQSKLPLVCLVHSGGKSIHGCVHVDAPDVLTWYAKRAQMVALFASDSNAAFRADAQAMRPRTGMRLAGVVRKGTGKVQRLVWLCAWRRAMELAGVAE